MTAVEYGNNYQDQSTNHRMVYTSNKAQCSLHDTKLDEKLDLGRIVGPMKSKQSENAE